MTTFVLKNFGGYYFQINYLGDNNEIFVANKSKNPENFE